MMTFVGRARAIGLMGILPALAASEATAQTQLPEIVITAPSPIVRRSPPRPVSNLGPSVPARSPATPIQSAPSSESARGTLPVVTDQFATVTVVPKEEITRNGASTLGDLLFSKPGITGSSFAPGASSRPIIRGLDVNRVRIQENGIGANGASDLGEDHFVPVDPLTTSQVEVIRGPATLRFGSQAIGGVVESVNNRIPTAMPCAQDAQGWAGAYFKAPLMSGKPCISFETKGGITSVDNGIDGSISTDAGGGNFAFHADMFGRRGSNYRVPHYPYLAAPDPVDAPRATQPGSFSGKQPNSTNQSDGASIGGSYIFSDGFIGLALTQNDALYHIPGIDGENHNTRIDAHQTKLTSRGEWRTPTTTIDAIRFWGGITDYKHNEIGLGDPTDLGSDGIQQTFTNKEQEGRVEVQFAPLDLRFASLVSAWGVQGGHQQLTAPSPGGAGLWDPNSNSRIAGYAFNEFKFSEFTKAQVAGRIETVNLDGTARLFDGLGGFVPLPVSRDFTPKSISVGLIQNLPLDLVGSLTAQYVERAPKPAELFSGGGHDATVTFDKGNPNLKIEAARSVEAGLRRAVGPLRFEATAYYTRFSGFIFRSLTGDTCDEDTGICGPGLGELREAIYSQRDATFRGFEFQSQWDLAAVGNGWFGVENQFDVVRATFTDGTNVPRIPPVRIGGGLFYRDANWLARVNLLHAFDQNDIAPIGETPTAGYNRLRAELSYTQQIKNDPFGLKEITVGIVGDNLLNDDIRNSVSYSKDEVLMPGASVRVFTAAKF